MTRFACRPSSPIERVRASSLALVAGKTFANHEIHLPQDVCYPMRHIGM
jgi:hypothetical protein